LEPTGGKRNYGIEERVNRRKREGKKKKKRRKGWIR